MNQIDADTKAQIRNHEDDLRGLAESDLPVAWAARALLDAADGDTDRDPTDGDGHARDRDRNRNRDRGRGGHR